jgi:hypothetical protein
MSSLFVYTVSPLTFETSICVSKDHRKKTLADLFSIMPIFPNIPINVVYDISKFSSEFSKKKSRAVPSERYFFDDQLVFVFFNPHEYIAEMDSNQSLKFFIKVVHRLRDKNPNDIQLDEYLKYLIRIDEQILLNFHWDDIMGKGFMDNLFEDC